MEKQTVIEFLSNCSGNELITILKQALEKRPESGIDPLETFVERKLVLAEASRILNDDDIWEDWEIRLIADKNPEKYDKAFKGEPFLQEGRCDNCKIEVASHVKNALCPICENEVWLT
jgi:hypothetical protein